MNSKAKNYVKSYIVYWAKHPHHSNAKTEGYVGITSNSLNERKKSHFKEARSSNRPNVRFHNVLKKYGTDIVWEVLHKNLSEKEAFDREAEYRPSVHIGWNSDRGGVKAISSEWYKDERNKEQHRLRTSRATKIKIAEKDTQTARSERAKAVWSNPDYKKSRAGEIPGDKNPTFGLFGADHPAAGHKKTAAGLKAISEAHKDKKLTQAKKKAISDARSAAIGVFDKDREMMYKRRMAGESVAEIALDYPITQKSVDRNIRKWCKKNNLPQPCRLKAKRPSQKQHQEKLIIDEPKNAEQKQKHKNLAAIESKASEKKRPTKKPAIDKSKIIENSLNVDIFEDQIKLLNTLATNNNQAKLQILGEISGAKKKTKSFFNQIKPILHKKIQINKNKLKFCERTLKRTKHIIDRKTGKFRGENARASKFQDSERGIICKRRINGETYAAIGKSYGKGVSTIKNICQNWGPKNGYPYETKIGKSNLKKVTSPKTKTAICKEYSEGISAMKLAIKYELSFQTVYTFLADWCPKNNIPYIKHKTD